MVYVSHDLAVVGRLADRVLVIYAGRAVELGPTRVLERPLHPYTRGLVGAIPVISQARMLATIPGKPPRPASGQTGCRFAERCTFALPECVTSEPELAIVEAQHAVRCIRAERAARRAAHGEPAQAQRRGRLTAPQALLEVGELRASYGSTEVLARRVVRARPRANASRWSASRVPARRRSAAVSSASSASGTARSPTTATRSPAAPASAAAPSVRVCSSSSRARTTR